MKRDRWQRVDQIFHLALAAPTHERKDVLKQSCDGDEKLLLEVEGLLHADELATDFIETPAFVFEGPSKPASTHLAAPGEIASRVGSILGHYRVVGEIGAGGMGVVYDAEDLELERHVALKFLPEGVGKDAA